MIKKLFIFILFSWSFYGHAQISLQAQEMVNEYQQKRKVKILSDTAVEEEYVGGLLSFDSTFNFAFLDSFKVKINTKTNHVYSVQIPTSNIVALMQLQGIQTFEVNRFVKPKLDSSRYYINVDSAYNGLGNIPTPYKGKGVVVGIVDEGLKTDHPTFYDFVGNRSRIVRVWDQNKSGNSPVKFGYGREYKTENEIMGSGNTSNASISVHGTHVTGIAAGGGGTTSFRGMAPEADIVFVDGPLTTDRIIDGIKYIFDYAKSVGKPAVVNLSLGSQIGPHDGTSNFDKALDGLVSPGYLVVGAAGNEGNEKLHTQYFFSNNQTVRSAINFKESNKDYYGCITGAVNNNSFKFGFEIWQKRSGRYEKTQGTNIEKTNISNKMFSTSYGTTTITANIIRYDSRFYIEYKVGKTNIDNNEKVVLVLQNNIATVHAWNEGVAFEKLLPVAGNDLWIGGDSDYTLGEIGGTSKKIIAVGAIYSKNKYKDWTNAERKTSAISGNLTSFSSKGPTADLRLKPEVVAPGSLVVSAISDASSFPANQKVTQNNGGTFGVLEGTSMAAPAVTGSVALMLEAKPNLTYEEAKGLLQKYADITPQLANLPETYIGKGHVNIYRTLLNITDTVLPNNTFATSAPKKESQKEEDNITIFPNPNKGRCNILGFPENSVIHITVLTLSGSYLSEQLNIVGQSVVLSVQQTGFYILQIKYGDKTYYRKVYIYE